MPTFYYTGRRHGELVKGYAIGQNEEAVLDQLRASAVTLISLELQQSSKNSILSFRSRKVSVEDLLMFCRQMYTLLRAGIPLVRALRGLGEMSTNRLLTEILSDVANVVEAGKPLATAFGKHPKVFSNLFVSMIHMGENTGKLDETFNQMASYIELEYENKKRIKGAMRYPSIVIVTITIALIIVNVFVIPVFAKIFKDFKAELPWATKILIAVSNFMISYWQFILLFLVAFIFAVRLYIRTPMGRYHWDYLKLKIPLLGKTLRYFMLARFARTFAVMFRAGVPVIHILQVSAQACANDYIAKHVQMIQNKTEAGEALSRSVAETKLFTPLVLQMISVGEETGALDTMLTQVAEFYEREVDYALRRLSDAIEPILISLIAGMVLILALGVFLPLWSLSTTLH